LRRRVEGYQLYLYDGGMETIKKAVSILGGVTALARSVGVSPQAIHLWLNGQTQLQARYAAAIEDATAGAVTAYAIGRECAAIAERDRAT
jgi:DNA-binding transcriptional regulator YdaS (Cro superfamily)